MDELGVSKSCRVMRLLDLRCFELKSEVHAVFDRIWKELIQVDVGAGQVTVYDSLPNDQMTLSDAVVGLKAYKEVDERMEQLWRNIDAAIVTPRMDAQAASVPRIKASADVLHLDGKADKSVEALLSDLETMVALLASKLPSDMLETMCSFMMGDMIPRLIDTWLSPAVPSSLGNMEGFEEIIDSSRRFCDALDRHGCTAFGKLREWVDDAPSIWLAKCRETALDTIRTRLTNGIGKSKQVEKVEKHMVSLSEGKELATTGAGASAETNEWEDDWGDAWDEDADEPTNGVEDTPVSRQETVAKGETEDDGVDAWGAWDDEDAEKKSDKLGKKQDEDEDDVADAWGNWGDDDAIPEPDPEPKRPANSSKALREENPSQGREQTRELVLKETYHISSMPEPVLELIYDVLEDAATLTKGGGEYGSVASTAPELFDLPTSALALFRAISPHYYALDGGGNMFLYNDAMYLAEQLSRFSVDWKQRKDLSASARGMVQFEGDVKTLQNFANRSYASEMNVQKTVLRDLVGGSQGLAGQDEWETAIESGTARIRTMAATWESILARSVWSQAVGSLADALASKLITDVLEMASIGQEEAYSIAKVIASATELDDLFLPSRLAGTQPAEDEVPTTAQYAPNWLRLKYLSEVLQSNLNEVKYLWLDSELSLYFSVSEVVDLIEASFEDNARTRDAIREIQGKPQPLA